MAVAKTGYIHRLCMESLHTDSFLREYRGICLGAPQPLSGIIDLPISRDPGSLLRRTVDPMGLPARTLYETLLPGELSLLRLLPQTAAPTSCGSTSPLWATRWPGTGSTAPRTPPSFPVRRCTPTVSGSCTP